MLTLCAAFAFPARGQFESDIVKTSGGGPGDVLRGTWYPDVPLQ